jgi:hypothetical protein
MSSLVLRVLVSVWAANLAIAAHADGHALRYLETAFSLYNPDWEARENASGVSLSGSLPLTRHVRVSAGINLLETDPVEGLTVRHVSGKPFENWRSIGLGIFGHGPSGTLWTADIYAAAVDIEGDTENGGTIMLGVQKSFDRLTAALGAGYLDLAIEDSIVEGTVAYEMTARWSAMARVRDYAEWDFTLYELGVRWRPRRD